MFARMTPARKSLRRITALAALTFLAACGAVVVPGGDVGQRVSPGATVPVALLVPSGSGQPSDELLAANLENAARMAIADLNGAEIDLRVYSTAGNPAIAADAATRAVNDGAKVILGPLYAEAANAAAVAVAGRNVNVLAFSNNPSVAGGNLFILGPTFSNTANRLAQFGTRRGLSRYLVVHGENVQGQVGRDAILNAVSANGGQVVGTLSYPLTQQAIFDAAPSITSAAQSAGADVVFTTAGPESDLPILATALRDRGLSNAETPLMGITRWDTIPQILAQPGVQNGYFALPDALRASIFETNYSANYGQRPHPLAGLAYDGIAAIGALVANGDGSLTRSALTQAQGFQGTTGVFRLLPNGMNERALAVATVRNNQVVILEAAPRRFGTGGL